MSCFIIGDYLIFNNIFDEELNGYIGILKKYNHIILGDKFNRTIDNLPQNIISLSLGRSFNKPINHLPLNLIALEINSIYEYSIDYLPPTLERLCIYNNICKSFHYIPSSLKYLTIKVVEMQFLHIPHNIHCINIITNREMEREIVSYFRQVKTLQIIYRGFFGNKYYNIPTLNSEQLTTPNIYNNKNAIVNIYLN